MEILHESVIPRRDLRIHEAGHYVVAAAFSIPVQHPRILAGLGGDCRFDHETIDRAAEQLQDDATIPQELVERAATRIASVFLAGFAAEGIHSGFQFDDTSVLGAGSSDLAFASRVLALAGIGAEGLSRANLLALRVLNRAWVHVVGIADMIPTTQPGREDFALHAAVRVATGAH